MSPITYLAADLRNYSLSGRRRFYFFNFSLKQSLNSLFTLCCSLIAPSKSLTCALESNLWGSTNLNCSNDLPRWWTKLLATNLRMARTRSKSWQLVSRCLDPHLQRSTLEKFNRISWIGNAFEVCRHCVQAGTSAIRSFTATRRNPITASRENKGAGFHRFTLELNDRTLPLHVYLSKTSRPLCPGIV